jgi:hypothetical protein
MNEEILLKRIILPSAYFPPVSWMALLLNSDDAFVEIQETYPKQTIRNRCQILSANGKTRLSIPVKKVSGNRTKTKEIEVIYEKNWQLIHFRSIESAYNKSPFYFHYRHFLVDFYSKKFALLTELNQESVQLVMQMLKTEKRLNYTTDWQKDIPEYSDFRQAFLDNSFFKFKPYNQVFSDRNSFQPDLSILDLIFNEGPESLRYLRSLLSDYSG